MKMRFVMLADTKIQKHQILIEKREDALKRLCDLHRNDNGDYDVIVPGSGGKDSAYASHVLKYKYGMNPLTVTWAPLTNILKSDGKILRTGFTKVG